MLSKKSADFFAFFMCGKLSFTLCPAKLAQLIDISAEIRSLVPKNNPTLTMFPQKDFISAG
jgi:hypothetical protein